MDQVGTAFVGRKRELAELTDEILLGTASLTTIVGTGGVGKSRLALEAIADAAVDAVFVPLATVVESRHVPSAIAAASGFQIPDTVEPWTALARAVGPGGRLLVLDNLEQIPELAQPLAMLLAHVPTLRIVATSRTATGIPGERLLPLSPLPLESTADQMSPAMQLFIDATRRVRAGYAPGNDDISAIDRLCHRLDGLPLSIEITAASMRVMSARDILRTLEQYPQQVLRLPARADSLAATIDRSYALLSENARRMFRRMALAPAGVTPVIAAALLDSGDAGRAIQELRSHHLITTDEHGRSSMLETIRTYASLLLADDDGANPARLRLAHALAEFTLHAGERQEYADGRAAIDAVNADWENIRQVMAHTLDSSPQDAAHLLVAAEKVVFARGHVAEAWTWINALLLHPLLTATPSVVLMAHRPARMQGLIPQSESLLDLAESLDITPEYRAWMNYERGTLCRTQREWANARHFLTLANIGFADLGHEIGRIRVLNALGCVEMDTGNWHEASEWFDEAHALAVARGAVLDESRITLNRGYLATLQGDFATAVALHTGNIENCERVGDIGNLAMNFVNLAGALIGMREWDAAEQYELMAVPLLRSLGNLVGEGFTLSGRIAIARGREDFEKERMLLSQLMDVRRILGQELTTERLQFARSLRDSGLHDDADAALLDVSASDDLLTVHRAVGAWYRGSPRSDRQLKRALAGVADPAARLATLRFVVETTGAIAPAGDPDALIDQLMNPARTTTNSVLTGREQEVLRLVAMGLSDRQIADALYISARTSGFHVSNILRKLNSPPAPRPPHGQPATSAAT